MPNPTMPRSLVTTSRSLGCWAVAEWVAIPDPTVPLQITSGDPQPPIRINGQYYAAVGQAAMMSDPAQVEENTARKEAAAAEANRLPEIHATEQADNEARPI